LINALIQFQTENFQIPCSAFCFVQFRIGGDFYALLLSALNIVLLRFSFVKVDHALAMSQFDDRILLRIIAR
jgi:hypothetical protein